MTLVAPGVCRHCGVTDAEVDGDRLRWLTSQRICCSKFTCRKLESERLQAVSGAKTVADDPYRGWGYGAKWIDKRKKAAAARRKSLRRKKRAA